MRTSLSMKIAAALPFLGVGLLVLCSCLGGCATIVEGTDQTITVATDPPNSFCFGSRAGKLIFDTHPGGNKVTVSKSRLPIELICSAAGFDTGTVAVDSSASPWGVAGALTIDFGITDYATGALNKYPETVLVTLKPTAGK